MRSGKYLWAAAVSAAVVVGLTLLLGPWPTRPESGSQLTNDRWVELRLSDSAYRSCRPVDSNIQHWMAPRWTQRSVDGFDCERATGAELSSVPPTNRDFVSWSVEARNELSDRHRSALQELVGSRDSGPKTYDAIKMLELEATITPERAWVHSDLAAAYAIRAGRQNRSSDLARAHGAAVRATELDGSLPAARFNRALIEERLQLRPEASQSWRRYLELDSSSPWAGEARSHLARLDATVRDEEAGQPSCHELGRMATPPASDSIRRRVREAIGPVYDCVLSTLLWDWVVAGEEGRAEDSRRALQQAHHLAEVVRSVHADSFLSEVVGAIRQAEAEEDEERLGLLRSGHRSYVQARVPEQAGVEESGRSLEESARSHLQDARSTLRWRVEIQLAWDRFAREQLTQDSLQWIGSQPEVALHRTLWLRFLALRANYRFFQNDLLGSLADFDDAIEVAGELRDSGFLRYLLPRRAGVYRVMGLPDRAWEDLAVLLGEETTSILENRVYLLGEAAIVARELDQLYLATMLQDKAIQVLESAETPSLVWLSIAHRVRLELCTGSELAGEGPATSPELRCSAADRQRYLQQARRATEQVSGESERQGLEARLFEVSGRDAVHRGDPRAAVADFTKALGRLPTGEFHSLVADLLVGRAGALLLIDEPESRARAVEDLRHSLEILKREEAASLSRHQVGLDSEFWSSYLARFQRAYDILIGLLVAEGSSESVAEAFSYSEDSRAYEPRFLLLQASGRPGEARPDPPDPQSILARIPLDTAVVEYEILEDSLVIWVLTREDLWHEVRDVSRAEVSSWAEQLHAALRARYWEGIPIALLRPSEELLQPVLGILDSHEIGPERLVFVPDGPIHALPFAALVDEQGNHIVESFTLSTAPSAQIFLDAIERDLDLSKPEEPSVLVVADPAFDANSPLAREFLPLPGAREEAQSIEALYRSRGARTQSLVGPDATVSRLLALGLGADVVHIAAHAVASPRFGDRSYLLLSPSVDRQGEVMASELVGGSFQQTRLVILSACETAGGRRPIGPIGVSALVRPFLGSGVPAVVGSLWNVGDQETKPLMVSFHRRLCLGDDAAKALQEAQLEFLEQEGELSNPGVWAGFQVVGYSSSPFQRQPSNSERCYP